MSFNLIDSVKALLGSDLANKAAGMLGENPENVQTAVSAIIPSVLTGILHKASSGDTQSIMNMAIDAAKNGIPENLTSLMGGGVMISKAGDMLKGLFGGNIAGLTNSLAGFSGISNESTTALLSVTAPAALGSLGKHAMDTNMNAGGLLTFLNTQKESILGALPSGLNLAGVLGLGNISGFAGKPSGTLSNAPGNMKSTTSYVEASDEAASSNRWVLPLILILALIGIVWYFMNRHSPADASAIPAADTIAKVSDAVAAPAAMESMFRVTLPDGTKLDASRGGIEDQLVVFLNDPQTKAGKDVWFNFDKLNFKTGSADITDESQGQVKNIAAILKAYPKLKIKIGGYTDRTGDSVSNVKLSGSRAAAVITALKAAGADPDQLKGSEGYGSMYARAAAGDPDELRMKDRRISVSIREK